MFRINLFSLEAVNPIWKVNKVNYMNTIDVLYFIQDIVMIANKRVLRLHI